MPAQYTHIRQHAVSLRGRSSCGVSRNARASGDKTRQPGRGGFSQSPLRRTAMRREAIATCPRRPPATRQIAESVCHAVAPGRTFRRTGGRISLHNIVVISLSGTCDALPTDKWIKPGTQFAAFPTTPCCSSWRRPVSAPVLVCPMAGVADWQVHGGRTACRCRPAIGQSARQAPQQDLQEVAG